MPLSRIEQSTDIKSPYTGGAVKEVFTLERQLFKGEEYWIHARYYQCVDTGEKFTTTEQDELTLNDLYSQYRIKHGIPFPDEIHRIRTNYSLSYAQIGRILGFGANQYAKYENGQLPSDSNGRMIGAVRYKTVMLKLVENLKDLFEADDYEKIHRRVAESREESMDTDVDRIIYEGTQRSIYNGFGEFNHRKVEEMVRYFVSLGPSFPTKLNKEMFYADFLHYRKYGQSISGLRYQAIHYGPVPVHYSTIYDRVPGLIRESIFRDGMESISFTCDACDLSVFNEKERGTLKEVARVLQPLTVKEIVSRSHEEPAWQAHYQDREIIPYSEAYQLRLMSV